MTNNEIKVFWKEYNHLCVIVGEQEFDHMNSKAIVAAGKHSQKAFGLSKDICGQAYEVYKRLPKVKYERVEREVVFLDLPQKVAPQEQSPTPTPEPTSGRKCGRCGQRGHNARTCKNAVRGPQSASQKQPHTEPQQRVCSQCGQAGHNARTCGKQKIDLTEYETAVTMFVASNQPATRKMILEANVCPSNIYQQVMSNLLEANKLVRHGKKKATRYFVKE